MSEERRQMTATNPHEDSAADTSPVMPACPFQAAPGRGEQRFPALSAQLR